MPQFVVREDGIAVLSAEVPIEQGPDAATVRLSVAAPWRLLYETLHARMADPEAAAETAKDLAKKQAGAELVRQAQGTLAVVERIKAQPDGAVKLRQAVAKVRADASLGDARSRMALGKLQLAARVQRTAKRDAAQGERDLVTLARAADAAKESPAKMAKFRAGVAAVKQRAARGDPRARQAVARMNGAGDALTAKRAQRAATVRAATFTREGRRFVIELPAVGKPGR